MAKCPNRNISEYKVLMAEFKTNLATDSIINSWQALHRSEDFPTVAQAKEFVKDRNAYYALKKQEFAQAVLNNLSRLNIISQFQGTFYVNNSDRETRGYDRYVLANNIARAKKYLEVNNIPAETVEFVKTERSYKVVVHDNLFTGKDILPESRGADSPHTDQILVHLQQLFPQVKIKLVTAKEAKEYYDSLPDNIKGNMPFDEIKSFYVNGTAVLIKGRVTKDTAIEEVLHPFIDAVKVDNPELFDSLYEDAVKNFPQLKQTIDDAYTIHRGFNDTHRKLELVTQALVRHFRRRYETKPTESFLNKIQQFLKWFADIVEKVHEYLTGKVYTAKVSDINSNLKLTDIAQMLNTSDLAFRLDSKADLNIRYALSDEKQRVVKHALNQANELQAAIINKLFHAASSHSESIDSLSAGMEDSAQPNIVIMDKKTHVYTDLTTGKNPISATTAIKGTLKNIEEVQLNVDIGTDFDKILEGIVEDKKFEDILPEIKILDTEQAKLAHSDLTTFFNELRADGSVIISQVILFDVYSNIAGTADILVISPQGVIKVIDLKTSKNFLIKKPEKYDAEYNLEKDSLLYQQGVKTLSTRQQHNLQVNLYRRMLENMGYEVSLDDDAATTYHIRVDVRGRGKEQVFNGKFEVEGFSEHRPSQNLDKVNILMPNLNADINAVYEHFNNTAVDDEFLDESEQMPEGLTDENTLTGYTIFDALSEYKIGLATRKEALEKIHSNIQMDRSIEETFENIENAIATISSALTKGSELQSATYTAMLKDAIAQVNKFTDYMLDPNNFHKAEYINYALNFERFAATFEGLHSINDSGDLNNTQSILVVNLISKLNYLRGTDVKAGIIDAAIDNYVKEIIKGRSTRDFTTDELDLLMKKATDISDWDYQTRDMATSPDTILALMDKLYKGKVQESLNKYEIRESVIKAAGAKLLKLSPTTDRQKIYDFMHEFDKDGKHTGRYVKRLGPAYYGKMQELKLKLMDDKGNWKEYKEIYNLDDANPDDIAYNKQLHKDKIAYSNFWRAETVGADDRPIDGEYHGYTEEFKEIRKKYESFIANDTNGYWIRKGGISDAKYDLYLVKYYDARKVQSPDIVNGVFTGKIRNVVRHFPKTKYRFVRDTTSKGVSLLNPKYESIMNPTDALGYAQKDFYEMYVKNFEEDLLIKLPVSVRDQMLGKIPVVKRNLMNNLKGKSNLVVNLWAKATRSYKNLTTETSEMRRVLVDESGDVVDSLPIFFIGNTRTEEELTVIENKISALHDLRRNNDIKIDAYKKELMDLEGQATKLRNKPATEELDLDLTKSLLKFSGMAEHYETMSTIEDTVRAMYDVLERRVYEPADPRFGMVSRAFNKAGVAVKDKWAQLGKKNSTVQSNVVRRARKWFDMVYYDNNEITKGMWEKIQDNLIEYTSLSYVAFNPFGSINNYVVGRINNSIEMMGGRFMKRESQLRAQLEFNKRVVPDMLKRLGEVPSKFKKANAYDPDKPMSKYEALVDMFRMMDSKADIRENTREYDEKTYLERAKEFGYILQDAAEYNVQTKIGIGLLMDKLLKNKVTGETLSIYDAFDFDSTTGAVKLKDGFDTFIRKNGTEVAYTDDIRYDIRNEIREVNKQIHGNYSKVDRMVLQSNWIGKFAAQFHKWVAPAIRARYGAEYYDENLGWMEGRYISFLKFGKYVVSHLAQIDRKGKTFKEGFLYDNEYAGDGSQTDDRAMNKLFGVYRTLGEIGIMISAVLIGTLLEAIWEDDDDSDTIKRLKNATMYQADRLYKEMVTFIPISPAGANQMYQMVSSPIAATRTMGELGEAISSSIITGLNGVKYLMTDNPEDWKLNKDVFYQRKPEKGQFKMNKQWKNATPLLYSIQRWDAYLRIKDFYIK